MEREIQKQAVKFWNSPWAMNTVWENGRGISARFFLENDDLMVEIEVPMSPGVQYQAQAEDTELRIASHPPHEFSARIPLPHPVSRSEWPDLELEEGLVHLRMARQGLKGKLPS